MAAGKSAGIVGHIFSSLPVGAGGGGSTARTTAGTCPWLPFAHGVWIVSIQCGLAPIPD
jgi:hypothetical protein